MHACGNFIYKCAQWTTLYTHCIKFVSPYGSITIWESGITCFINIPEYWFSHGCTTDGLVDACEQEHPDRYQGRETC